MTKKNKYISFKLLENKPKTLVYAVINNKLGNILGIIKWYSSWRKYCFFPEENTLYDVICLGDIKDFIQDLMDKRMVVKNGKKKET